MHIFLDIDGVMAPCRPWEKQELLPDGIPEFTESAVSALKELLRPDTHVVLITSHRDRYSIEEWKRIFQRRGLEIESLEKIAPFTFDRKANEILNWFKDNPTPYEFIIIDDDSMLRKLPAFYTTRMISPSPTIGLTLNQVLESQWFYQ